MELLHNGIELPDAWPPATRDPRSAEPMQVPYLERPPETVPVDVGRQLFVDDFLIVRTDLRRTFHSAVRHEGNPVLTPATDVELCSDGKARAEQGRAVCYLGHGGVFLDRADGLYRMYYTAGWRGPLALALSEDGIHWRRAQFGDRKGNVILKDAGGDNCVWLDPGSVDQSARVKLLSERRPGPHQLHTSGDGLTWSRGSSVSPGELQTGGRADYSSFYYDPFRRVWVFSIKQSGPRGRCRYYREATSFLAGADWSGSVYWTNADRLDEPDEAVGDAPQLYSLNAVAYESLMVGMHYIHRGPDNETCFRRRVPKLTDLELGFSRDGFHWHRPDRSGFLRATRIDGDWDRGYLHGTAGVVLVRGDSLLFPYTGFSGVAPDGSRGMYYGGSIGIAVLRRDGFASMDSGRTGGTLLTRCLLFNGARLFANVDCPQGALRAEILDADERVISPYSIANSIPISTDSTKIELRWKGCDGIRDASARRVRIRFHLEYGRLYSFWVSDDERGLSGGRLPVGSEAVNSG